MKKNILAQINTGIILSCNVFAEKNDEIIGGVQDKSTGYIYDIKDDECNINGKEDKTSESIFKKIKDSEVENAVDNDVKCIYDKKNGGDKKLSDFINLDEYYIYGYTTYEDDGKIYEYLCTFSEDKGLSKHVGTKFIILIRKKNIDNKNNNLKNNEPKKDSMCEYK